MKSSPLADTLRFARTLDVKVWWPAASAEMVRNVTAYVSGPVLTHCPYPGLSSGAPNDTEEIFVTPPSALKVPRPTNGSTRVGVTVLNQAPTNVLRPLGVPCAATSVGATAEMTSATESERLIRTNLLSLVPTILTSLPARNETRECQRRL